MAKILNTKEEIRDTIKKIKEKIEKKHKGTNNKIFRLMSCHGPDHKDSGLAILLKPLFIEIIKSENWTFYEVTGIYSDERLKMKMEQCKGLIGEKGYLVRAFITVNSPSVINPLIIGENDVILGTDDEKLNTPKKAVHLHGKKYAELFETYFNSHFNKRNIYTLRDDDGIDNDEVTRLKNKLSKIINI